MQWATGAIQVSAYYNNIPLNIPRWWSPRRVCGLTASNHNTLFSSWDDRAMASRYKCIILYHISTYYNIHIGTTYYRSTAHTYYNIVVYRIRTTVTFRSWATAAGTGVAAVITANDSPPPHHHRLFARARKHHHRYTH